MENKLTYSELITLAYNTAMAAGLSVDPEKCVKYATGWETFCEMMTAEDFYLQGTGHFSAVFGHKSHPDLAFKFGFKVEDSGSAYAAWCRQQHESGNGNVHIPMIHHIERNKLFYSVVMPRYRPLVAVCPEIVDEDGDIKHWTIEAHASNVLDYMVNGYFTEYHEVVKFVNDWVEDEDQSAESVHVTNELKRDTVFLTLRRINKHFRGLATFDLHDENYMFDQHGNIVITDPVSYTEAAGQ